MDTAAELEKARALSRFGRHKAAAEICQRILERQPNRADALLILGSIAYDLGDSRAAVGFASRIVDRTPAHPGAAILFANALAKLAANDSALAWYRVALDIDDDKSAAAAGMARLLVAGGQLDEIALLAESQLAADRASVALDVVQIGRRAAPGNAALAHVAGRALVAAGRMDEAASPLMVVLLHAPQDPAAAEALGLALRDVPWLKRALAIRSSADTLASLGDALASRGNADAAARQFEAALAIERTHRRAGLGLARLHLDSGKADIVIGLARKRLAEAPGDVDAARMLGEALTRRGLAASALTYAQTAAKSEQREIAEAVADGIRTADPHHLGAWRMVRTARACRVVLAHEPADAAAMVELGTFDPVSAELWPERAIAFDSSPRTLISLARARLKQRDKEAAKALLRPLLETIGRSPFLAELADLLVDVGEAETAAKLLKRAIVVDSEDRNLVRHLIRAYAALGDATALAALGQAYLGKQPMLAAEALAAFRRLDSESPHIAFLHGQALWDADKTVEAIDAFVDAAEMATEQDLNLMTGAGEALVNLRAPDLALRYLGRAVELDFANPERHTYSYFFNFLNECDWPARADYIARLTKLGEAKIAADDPDFRMNPSLWVFLAAERDLMYRSANHFARHTFPRSPPPPPAPTGADPDRPIRLGYLSAFLSNHHIGYSLQGIVRAHDRSQVKVHLYSQTRDDKIQAELKRHAYVFRPIDGKTPEAIARMIAADGIDVLVDLDGYVNGANGLLTLKIASQRAAPIQMLYHNYVGPTGTGFVDYVIADRELFDAHDDAGYRERLIRLPPCYYPAAPLPKSDVKTERRSWELPETGIVFCNFGHFYKIEPTSFDAWMRILTRVPGSVLWMNHWDTPQAVANLRKEAQTRGVDPARLVFSALADKPLHLARLGLADLFLDTFVYASGVTSLDVLWGGIPVLTVRGSTFARRVGASLNAGIGLEDMTCADPAAFEDLAVALAADRPRLASIKAKLAANLRTHPLFDQARLTRNLERAYRTAFRRYVDGKPPESFELAP